MANQTLQIKLTAIDKTQRAFKAVAAGMARVKRSIMSVQSALVGLAAAAALREFSQQIDELAKQSGLLGLTVNQLQQLQFAASQTGVTTAELNKGLERFSRSISEASTGIGVGKRSFDALGISLSNTDGSLKPTNQLLSEVANRFAAIKDPADRVRVAVDLFGRSGAGLVNTLADGAEGLQKLGDEFNAVTLQLTGEQAEAVENANDLFDKLGRTFSSIGQQITAVVLPALAKVANFFTINILRAVAASTKGLRGFLNELVELTNTVTGGDLQTFTFGENLEKEIERLTFNLENAHRGVIMTEDGIIKLTITEGKAAEQTSIFSRETDKLANSISRIAGPVEFSTKGIRAMTVQFDKTLLTMKDVRLNGINSLEDALVSIADRTSSVKDAFKSMARSIISDMIRMQVQQSITGPLMNLFGMTVGNMPFSPAGKAIGGPVQAGQPYVVGERGPEMFVPNQSGSIVPNGRMGGGGIVVNQTVNISTGVQQTVRAEVMQMLPQISNAAKGAVLDARRRGGSFAAAF
jgi:hypothetical protein